MLRCFLKPDWSIPVGSFRALIQEGWIRIVASHRGLPRAFTKSLLLLWKHCELSDMLLALTLNLGGTVTLKAPSFSQSLNSMGKTKMGGNPSLFLNVFKYCATFPVFMFSPPSGSPLPLSETLLSFVWASTQAFALTGSIIYGCPSAEPSGPVSAAFCGRAGAAALVSSSISRGTWSHSDGCHRCSTSSLPAPVGCWPQQDSHHPLRGDRAALGLALLLIPLVYKLKLFVFSVIQCFLLGSSLAWHWFQMLQVKARGWLR